ncbi:MAG: hypothetical protein DRO15_02780 [Thermoprotei archaeon]|nr:MAG: hypothetical protein DRO15_02780 [Thermoprotei archaeon]
MKVRVEAEIRPTENEDKVMKAVTNVFIPENTRIVEMGKFRLLIAESSKVTSLLKLHELLRRERILDAARIKMLRGAYGSILHFKIHKQAAYQGRLSFVDDDRESPLGAISFTIECRNPRELIDWLAPRTAHGRPLWEKEIPREL